MKNTDKHIIASLKELLNKQNLSIVIIPHENPDGDAIGSAIGLAEVLNNIGHNTSIISPTNYPDFLKWFSSKAEIMVYSNNKNKAKSKIKSADLMFCLDFNEVSRAGKLKNKILEFTNPKILIDKH